MDARAQGPNPPQMKTATATFAYSSALFNAAGLTDSAVIWSQPADSILLYVTMKLDAQFDDQPANAMSDLDITVGDVGDDNGILAKAMNLTSDAVGTVYETKGALWDATAGTLYKAAATDWTAYATAVGANLSTLSAGQVTFQFVYLSR